MNLRPHHLLCLNFFVGKGYSEEFVSNMTQILSALKNQDPLIRFRYNDDSLCKACLNYQNGRCSSEEKVLSYDDAVVSILEIELGKEYRYSEINKEVIEKILKKVPLEDICKNCCWKDICYLSQKEKYLQK